MASLLAKELMARQLQIEISRNNKALLNGLLQMEKRRNENKFLETVYQDYKRYHDYIIKEKEKQKLQMEFLLEYLEETMSGREITQEMQNRAKFERKNILRSLTSIRNDLTELTKESRVTLEKCKK